MITLFMPPRVEMVRRRPLRIRAALGFSVEGREAHQWEGIWQQLFAQAMGWA